MSSLITLPFDTLSLECGEITYALADELLAEMLTLDSVTGQVTLESVSETSWVGTHIVQFVVYLGEYDPNGTRKETIPLTLTIRVEEPITDFNST